VSIYRIGAAPLFSSFKTRYLSSNFGSFFDICEFKNPFCKNFYINNFYYQPFILIGEMFVNLCGINTAMSAVSLFLNRLKRLSSRFAVAEDSKLDFMNFGFLNLYSSRIHTCDVGFLPGPLFFEYARSAQLAVSKDTAIVYSIGADELFLKTTTGTKNWFIYQGSHGNGVAAQADLVFPTTVYVERPSLYRNLLGVLQKSSMAISYNFAARTDREIFKGLLDTMYGLNIFSFIRLNFYRGVYFNYELLISAELLVDNKFKFFNSIVIKNLSPTHSFLNLDYWYIQSYKYLLSLPFSSDISLEQKFYLNSIPTNTHKVLTGTINSRILNYYGDTTSVLVLASKTMNLCSNLYLKRNFSFSSIYY